MKHLSNPGRARPRAVAASLVWGSPGVPTGVETIFTRVFTRSRLVLLRQFLRFAAVGFGGFLIDNACVYGLRGTIGLYWAGLVAWAFAATGTWVLNRIWTFRGSGRGPSHRQYLSFLTANAFTFALNRGVYFTLITISPLCVQYPVLAIIAGTASGMFLNFHLFRTVVFK
jgi:putative flippase GtrA